jgi:hypothetical protein
MKLLKKTGISRRTFLRGAGAAMALPMLEAMGANRALAQNATPPRRFFSFYVPNGIHMPGFTPTTTGADYALTPILQPLAAHKSEILVLSGLDNYAATAQGDGPGDHARGTGCFMTCAHPVKTEGADISIGISADQVIAQAIGDQTRFSSLELGCDGGASTGGCDSGYSCAYSRNISWAGPSTPLPKETNPRALFDRMFAGFDPTQTAEQIARRKLYRQSVIDFVKADADSLMTRLGQTDQHKMDEYLTGIRELEQRLDEVDTGTQCTPIDRPTGVPADFRDHVTLMLDLVVLAMQCDLTRVSSFMLGNGGSGRVYGFLGISDGHHQISHHQGDAGLQSQLQTIGIWEVEQLAYLLGKMKAIDEGGSTLLDNSMVFFSSEIEDGNSHSHYNLPVILAGGGGGAINSGRHLDFGGDSPIANLFLSIINNMGVSATSFGDDGTAPLSLT